MDAFTAFNGKWKLDNSRSEKIGAFIKEMGAPWIAQKAADSASPVLRVTVTADGLELKNYGLIGSTKNFYALGAPSTHTAMDGSKCPASLAAGPGAGVLTLKLSHARGDIEQVFSREGADLVFVIILSRGGVEVMRTRRVHIKQAD
jgi:hypothetical protein